MITSFNEYDAELFHFYQKSIRRYILQNKDLNLDIIEFVYSMNGSEKIFFLYKQDLSAREVAYGYKHHFK